jgi:hypothetical protein
MQKLFIVWLSLFIFSPCSAQSKTAVRCAVTIKGEDLKPVINVRMGELGLMRSMQNGINGSPPLGWSFVVRPKAGNDNDVTAFFVVRATKLNKYGGKQPVTMFSDSTYRFSLPVDGEIHSPSLPGFKKIKIKLDSLDACGNPIVRQKRSGMRNSLRPFFR